METQRSFQFVLVAAALTVAAATADPPVLAAEGTITDDFALTSNHSGICPETANMAVSSSEAMIDYLRKAEDQLNSGSISRARSILSSSLGFIRDLQFMKEETGYTLHHIINPLEMRDAGVGILSRDWIGSYSSLDEMEVYAPEVAQEGREIMEQAEKHESSGDIKQTARTLKKIATEVPSSLQPGHVIDRQILRALELLGQHEPDIATAKSVVENAINRLMADARTTTAKA